MIRILTFLLTSAVVGHDLSHVVIALAGDGLAVAMNLSDDFVAWHGLGFLNLGGRANQRATETEGLARRLDPAFEFQIMDVFAVPR